MGRAHRWISGILGIGLAISLAGQMAWSAGEHVHQHEELPAGANAAQGRLPADSIYQLEGQWTDQDGVRAPLAADKGRAQVIAMFYTSCDYTCPLIVDEMKKVERGLPPELKGRVGFALYSFDPARDSVAALKAYAAKRDIFPPWRLYTAAADDVLELAAVLGVRFRKEASGDFSHSTILTVLDRNGVIRYQMLGLNQDRAPLWNALRAAAQR